LGWSCGLPGCTDVCVICLVSGGSFQHGAGPNWIFAAPPAYGNAMPLFKVFPPPSVPPVAGLPRHGAICLARRRNARVKIGPPPKELAPQPFRVRTWPLTHPSIYTFTGRFLYSVAAIPPNFRAAAFGLFFSHRF